MCINIVLNGQLVDEVQALSKIRTKQESVEQPLGEFVAHRKRLALRELKGTGGIREDYDYISLRAGEGES